MLEKTRGIVLHTLRYADQKQILMMFTEGRGAVSFMVRMPRGRRSVMQNVLLSPLSLLEVDMDFQDSVCQLSCHFPYPAVSLLGLLA